MRQENEPSVEDILASIKKVIASDQRVGASRRRAPEPATPDEAEEVLDLGEAGQDLGTSSSGELVDRLALRFKTQAGPALTRCRDPLVGDELRTRGSSVDHVHTCLTLVAQVCTSLRMRRCRSFFRSCSNLKLPPGKSKLSVSIG